MTTVELELEEIEGQIVGEYSPTSTDTPLLVISSHTRDSSWVTLKIGDGPSVAVSLSALERAVKILRI